MTVKATREQRRQLARENAKQPKRLQEVPREQWPWPSAPHLRILRSRDFLVQIFEAPPPAVVRLTVCRTEINGARWRDGISWDDLQRIKAECGYSLEHAVEVYPPDPDVVNDANMRHLWVLAEPIPFAWRKRPQPRETDDADPR